MTVLDASAVLTLVHDEPGADRVASALPGALLGAANLAEVIGKLVDAGVDGTRVRQLIGAAGLRVEPLTEVDAELAGSLRALPRWPCLVVGRPLLPGTDPAQRPTGGPHCRPGLD